MTPSTPKTFIHMARDAPMGVVLYRRSHLTTYVLKLDHKDRLIKGSRFYGRLFPERSDISPDGKLFIYFAMRGMLTAGKARPATWTAVCEPPFLKALVFCPNGSTVGGGGVFLRDKRLVIFDTPDRPVDAVRGYKIVRNTNEMWAAENQRLMALYRHSDEAKLDRPKGVEPPFLLRSGKKRVSTYNRYTYELRSYGGADVEGAEKIVLADWAGWDFKGRLVVASGRLIKFYYVKHGKPLYKPVKILDIEDAIA